MEQDQFLEVVAPEEAARRWHSVIRLEPLPPEDVPLASALGRILAADVTAPGDIPGFHRSDVDGYAVRASDTFGATEDRPVELTWSGVHLRAGVIPPASRVEVTPGHAVAVETGAVVPRGADAVVMVENTHRRGDGNRLQVDHAVVPGQHISFAGSDVVRGETVLWAGQELSSRETAVLAALGIESARCFPCPRVAVISTGNELVPPGAVLREGEIHDVNARAVADAVREAGGVADVVGIVPDDEEELKRRVREALGRYDVIVLSGGTSKGHGDYTYRVIDELGDPGVVVHGVALKPGKPLCLAAVGAVPVVVLPGFPVSALVTFHDFVAPVVRALGGRDAGPPAGRKTARARAATRWHSVRGRREYRMVHLVERLDGGLSAYAIGKGSGSITGFAHADGFVVIDTLVEQVFEGDAVDVQLLGGAGQQDGARAETLDAIGSHCLGLDDLLRRLRRGGARARVINVGSLGGIEAVRRGEADVAGLHLLDERSGEYNAPFLSGVDAVLVGGYGRRQGIVYRESGGGSAAVDALAARTPDAVELARALVGRAGTMMVNRNRGSGTRILVDRLLDAAGVGTGDAPRLPGYSLEARSHNAVAATVAHGKADWGVAIENVAEPYGLGFRFLSSERYDFAIPRRRLERSVVRRFVALLRDADVRAALVDLGFEVDERTGSLRIGSAASP